MSGNPIRSLFPARKMDKSVEKSEWPKMCSLRYQTISTPPPPVNKFYTFCYNLKFVFIVVFTQK